MRFRFLHLKLGRKTGKVIKVALDNNKKVIHEVNAVDSVLETIGITTKQIQEIVSKGQMIRNTVTLNHPKTAAGTFAYHEMVKAIRDALLPLGWTRQTVNNCELTAHPVKNINISVSGGDEQTGNQYGIPETKNPKGSQTELLVVENANQYDMFTPSNELAPDNFNTIICQNWILLYHHDNRKNEVRIELSLPISIGRSGKINGWHLRLIIEPIQLSPEEITIYKPDYAPEPEIKIERRGQEQK